jgi:peptidyl-prolyl cis-trans isomerase SurA
MQKNMKQFTFITSLFLSSGLFAAIEILDRVAVIVDDGVIMESQINSGLENMILRYDEQNIQNHQWKTLRNRLLSRS